MMLTLSLFVLECGFNHKEVSMDAQYSFRIPVETLEALKKNAEAQDLSVAQLIRRVLKVYVESSETKE